MPTTAMLQGTFPADRDFTKIQGVLGISRRADEVWRYLDGRELEISKFAAGTLAA
jgi:hypothetical protein